MAETTAADIIPQNDAQRVEALHKYKILEASAEASFNNIAHIMAGVFNTPIALISLVDKDKVFFKGNVGMPGVKHTPRHVSLCSFAILSDEPTVFTQPLNEPCLLTNPLVHGNFGLRFYAGAPLVTTDGYNIGSVCIVDKKSRTFSQAEQDMLVRFSKLVMHEIELHYASLLQKEAEVALLQNRERFEMVVKATQDAIWDWDLKTNQIWWSEGFKTLFGYKAEQIESTVDSWYNRLHPDDTENIIGGIHAVIASGGKNWSSEYRFRKADGSYAVVFDRGYILHDQEGRPYRMLGSMQDISERKKGEEALKNQSALIETIANNATSTLYMMDSRGYCTFINSTGERMFGYTLEELKQRPMHELVHHHRADGSFYPKEECMLEKALRENFIVRGQHDYFFRKDGSSFPASCSASPIFENGVAVSAVIEVRDITLEIEAEQALRMSAAELEQKVQERTEELRTVNEQLKQFSYAASHDLQEPLRKISFFLDRLLTNLGELSDDNRRIADRIQHTVNRMRSLIDDLLNYSNTTLGTTSFRQVDLTAIVKEVLDDMEATIIEKSADIKLESLPYFKGDQRQLKQMFQNLISNALKYHKKEEAPQVQISSRLVTGWQSEACMPVESSDAPFYEIQVKDSGIGFHQDDAERIFKLFQRLHGKAEYEGTGVGLAIVQKVVENHNGYICVESTPGEGATFKVLLPAV